MRNSTQRNDARFSRTGFTVTELVVVVAIIGLIVALVIPAIGKVRSQGRTLKCLTNQRTITLACSAYAFSNAGKCVSPLTKPDLPIYQWTAVNGNPSPGAVMYSAKHAWVADFFSLQYMVTDPTSSSIRYETTRAIEEGTLFPYIGSVAAYCSPHEPAGITPMGTVTAPAGGNDARQRLRSYSLNSFIGVRVPEDAQPIDRRFVDYASALGVPLERFDTTSLSQVVQPSRTMLSIVEGDNQSCPGGSLQQGANYGGWIIDPVASTWVDTPAMWNPSAITLSYVDGSTESYELKNLDLPAAFCATPHDYQEPTPTGTDFPPDWKWFRDRLLPGVIPNSTRGFSE